MDPCDACAIAKARQKNLPTRVEVEKKVIRTKVKANVPNGRIYLDLTTIKTTKLMKEQKISVSKPVWNSIVDEMTGMKFTDFF